MIALLIHYVFLIYTLLLIVRIVASWFPSAARSRWLWVIAQYTDPYLNIFRKIIPPIGGTLDLSPILAFFGLQIMEMILMKLFG